MESKEISFEKSIELAQRKTLFTTTTPVNYLNSDLARYSNYIKKIQENNPELSLEELEKKLLDDFHFNLTSKIFESGFSFENYMDLNSCKYLQSHGNEFEDIWNHVSSKDFKLPATSETFQDYLESYVYELYIKQDEIYRFATYNFDRPMLDILSKYAYNSQNVSAAPREEFKELEKYIKSHFADRRSQQILMDDAKIVCFGPKNYLKFDQQYLEETLKTDLKNSIIELTKTLKKCGAFDKYESVNIRNLRKFQFPEFQTNSLGEPLYVSLDNLPNSLSTLNIDDLMILNTFWLNRYTKEISCYADCLSAIREYGLLPQLLEDADNQQFKQYISLDQFKYMSEKKAILRPIVTDFILKKQQDVYNSIDFSSLNDSKTNINETDKKTDEAFSGTEKYVVFSYDPLKAFVQHEEFSKKYKDYFSNVIPESENDPCEDIVFYANLFNPSISAYSQKSDYLSALITNIESNRNIINAGIIPNRYSTTGTHVVLNRFVGLGIDAKLTYPVREHLSLNFLRDFVRSYTGSSIIPIYAGAEDFIDPISPEDNSYVSAQLVLPFSPKQSELLKKTVKQEKYSKFNKGFIQHMYFLSNSKRLPDSFITEKTSSSGKTKKVFERKYVDLDNGRIYTIDKNGNYIPYQPNNLKKGNKEQEEYDR